MPAIQMQWKPPVSTSGKFRKPLDLNGDARLDPKRFENMWEEYLQRLVRSCVYLSVCSLVVRAIQQLRV